MEGLLFAHEAFREHPLCGGNFPYLPCCCDSEKWPPTSCGVALGDGRAGYGNWMEFLIDTVDGSEVRRSSVEVGSLPPSFLQCFLHPRWLFGISSINSTWADLLTSFSEAPTQPTTALARKTRSEIWIWSEWNLNQNMESEGLKPSANQGAFVLACCWGLFLQKLRCPWTAQQQNWEIHHVSINLQGAAWYRTGVFLVSKDASSPTC